MIHQQNFDLEEHFFESFKFIIYTTTLSVYLSG